MKVNGIEELFGQQVGQQLYTPTIIQTAVPTVHVRDRYVLQWLRSMNISIGKPVTLVFNDETYEPGSDPDGQQVAR